MRTGIRMRSCSLKMLLSLLAISGAMTSLPAQTNTVRLLFGYTPAAENWLGGWNPPYNISLELDHLVANVNTIFTNSQTGIAFRLAGKYRVNYQESTDMSDCPSGCCPYPCGAHAYGVDLDAWQYTGNGMDEVFTRRAETAADICILINRQQNYDVGGAASRYNPFTVVADWDMVSSGGTVTAHEIGHLFGLREFSGWTGTYGSPPLAYGTIMTYQPNKLPYFCGAYANVPPYGALPCIVGVDNQLSLVAQGPAMAATVSPQATTSLAGLAANNRCWYEALATTSLTTGAGTTVDAGGGLQLRSTGTITIGSGLTITSGGKLDIACGPTALAKRGSGSSAPEPEAAPETAKKEAPLAGLSVRMSGKNVRVAFGVQKRAPIEISIHDFAGRLLARKDMNPRDPGNFDEVVSVPADAPRAVFVVLRIGKTVKCKQVMFQP